MPANPSRWFVTWVVLILAAIAMGAVIWLYGGAS